jgi:hypothetical protein
MSLSSFVAEGTAILDVAQTVFDKFVAVDVAYVKSVCDLPALEGGT